MKIYYKTTLDPDGYPKIACHELWNPVPVFCCEAMKKNFGESAIDFGATGYQKEGDHDVNIYEHDWGDPKDDPIAIQFCPWCGQPIETIEKERTQIIRTSVTVTKSVVETRSIEVPVA